jgi:hypothetical protein
MCTEFAFRHSRVRRRMVCEADPAEQVEGGNDHNGCNGCSLVSFGFAAVRSPELKSLQTGGSSERARTGANARQLLPCRRSWVRVPSSALKPLQISRCRIRYWQRWLLRGCTGGRIVAHRGSADWRFVRVARDERSEQCARIPCKQHVRLHGAARLAQLPWRSTRLGGGRVQNSAEGHLRRSQRGQTLSAQSREVLSVRHWEELALRASAAAGSIEASLLKSPPLAGRFKCTNRVYGGLSRGL